MDATRTVNAIGSVTTATTARQVEPVEDHVAGTPRKLRRLDLAHRDFSDAVAARLLRKEVRLAPSRREAHDPESLRIALNDVEGLAPDRARAAEDDDVSSLGHDPIVLRSSP